MNQVVISLPLAIGAARAKSGAVDIDDIGVDRLDRLIPETQPFDPCHADIMDEDIGLLQQCFENGFIFRFFDVEVDGFFVAVERRENGAMLLAGRITAMAHQVAGCVALAIFDFNDLRAKVGQLHGGIRSKDNRGHVDNLNPFQRTGWFFVPRQFRPFRHVRSPYLLHRLLAYLSVQLRDNRE